MDWTTLLPTALGGILALAGGAITQILTLRSERRKRVHQRSEDAAKAILDRYTELLVAVRRSYILDMEVGDGYSEVAFESYLEDEYQRDFVTISANAALIDGNETRQLLTDLAEAVSVSGRISAVQGKSGGMLEVTERLLEHGQTVAGAYLLGESLRKLDPELRKSIAEDLVAAKRAREQLFHPVATPSSPLGLNPIAGTGPSPSAPPINQSGE